MLNGAPQCYSVFYMETSGIELNCGRKASPIVRIVMPFEFNKSSQKKKGQVEQLTRDGWHLMLMVFTLTLF